MSFLFALFLLLLPRSLTLFCSPFVIAIGRNVAFTSAIVAECASSFARSLIKCCVGEFGSGVVLSESTLLFEYAVNDRGEGGRLHVYANACDVIVPGFWFFWI